MRCLLFVNTLYYKQSFWTVLLCLIRKIKISELHLRYMYAWFTLTKWKQRNRMYRLFFQHVNYFDILLLCCVFCTFIVSIVCWHLLLFSIWFVNLRVNYLFDKVCYVSSTPQSSWHPHFICFLNNVLIIGEWSTRIRISSLIWFIV